MISNDETKQQIQTLTELGLTTTQAKILLALVKSKNLTAQKISAISTVSRPDVYRVLNQLQDAGLVEKIISKPEEFQAISIEECISLLLDKRNKKTQCLQKRGLTLVQSVEKMLSSELIEEKSRNEFIFIPSKVSAYSRSEKMIKTIQKSMYFFGLTKRMGPWLSQYLANMEEALSRNIDCRMVMSDYGPSSQFISIFRKLQKYPNFKVKSIDSPKSSFSLWDNKEILLTTSAGDMPYPSGTLWSSNRSLIELCADYFECLWIKAKEP